MNFLHFTQCVKYTLLSLLFLGHLVIGQEIIDFGAKDRAEANRLQQVIQELCKNRPVNEYFRLSAESNCRDAVRCVNNDFGGGPKLAAIRCPAGLVFDLDGQTCNWASQVSISYEQISILHSILRQRYFNLKKLFDFMNFMYLSLSMLYHLTFVPKHTFNSCTVNLIDKVSAKPPLIYL